jgi:hypothetical protein
MLASSPAQRLAGHVRHLLGGGPFLQPGGWTHMGAVICDVSFQPRCNYERTLRPRLLHLQLSWADARTVRGFQRRLVTEDLAVAMKFNHVQKVATAHAITDLLAAHGVDTREDLHTWLDHQANRAALRTVKGVGPKSIDYIAISSAVRTSPLTYICAPSPWMLVFRTSHTTSCAQCMRKPPRFSGTTKADWSMPFGGIGRRPRSHPAGLAVVGAGYSRLIARG